MFKTFIAGTLIIGTFCTLIALGIWQLDRLQWKENIVAQLDQKNSQNPTENPLSFNGEEFERGFITGQFLYNTPPLFVGPRTHKKESGYHIHQPFKTNAGATIMVNRGWIPATMRDEVINLPQTTMIGGYLKHPDKAGMSLQNRPDINLWYWADIDEINSLYNMNAIDMVLYQEIGNDAEYPVLFSGLPYPRNKHGQYAIFWFGMALILLILTLILYRKPKTRA